MVRKCIICKKTWNKMIYRSFHRFPKEYDRRETWMEHLCVTESDLLKTKDALVCSDHFELEDVYTNLSGQHFLKFNAVPKKLVIVETSSLNASQNVLPTIERDEFNFTSILNEPTDTNIEEEKKLFWNADIKQEPYDLYLENISSPIERHVNASPNFEECNVLVKKELNSDNNNEHTGQHLKCSTIKEQKQRKLKKYVKKTNSLGGIIVCEVCGNMFTKRVDFFCHFLTSHRFKWRKVYKTKINQKQIDNTKTTNNYNTITIDPNIVVTEEIVVVKQELKEESQETDQLNTVEDFKSCTNKNVTDINTENCDTDKKTSSFPQNRCFNTNLNKKEKPFKCDICSKSFLHKSPLNIHMRFHTKEKPFKCDICLKCFSQKSHYNVHMRSHKGETPFKCETCSKSFKEKGTLNRHLRCHTGEKPFKCEICLKSFRHKGTLNSHMSCHTKEKPHECKICSKSFSQKGTLRHHMRCHTGEKPYKCDICFKYFTKGANLNIHMRCHTGEKPFECEICLKSFRVKDSLNRHMRCHTGEKPYECTVCLKSFTKCENLKRHMRCHTGEKPYKCEVCSKYFNDKCNLNKHIRCHKDEK